MTHTSEYFGEAGRKDDSTDLAHYDADKLSLEFELFVAIHVMKRAKLGKGPNFLMRISYWNNRALAKVLLLYKIKVFLVDTSYAAIQAAEDQTVKTTVDADYAALENFLDWSVSSIDSIFDEDFNDVS